MNESKNCNAMRFFNRVLQDTVRIEMLAEIKSTNDASKAREDEVKAIEIEPIRLPNELERLNGT